MKKIMKESVAQMYVNKGKIVSAGWGGKEEGRNDPNIVCTYEEKKRRDVP
jgi:hypothetical protein